MSNYYVYVYIDPRNFEEFYYGKGKGSRKNAHLFDESDSEKVRRISAIKKAGLEPIIRVIARNLAEHDALLVEKTLLWKLGRNLTNISSGFYGSNFRPHDTMHVQLTGFDFQNGIYYYNVGDGLTRCWEDYKTFGFISAGGGARWRDAMIGFQAGDVVAAYLRGRGFVGIGQIKDRAKPVREVIINGKPLLHCDLHCKGLEHDAASDEKCEYVAPIKWVKAVPRNEAKWRSNSGIYTTTHVRASLDGQPDTIKFLEQEFGIDDLRTLVA
jgi:hypothetical protein